MAVALNVSSNVLAVPTPDTFVSEKFSSRVLSEVYASRVSIAKTKVTRRLSGNCLRASLLFADVFIVVTVYSAADWIHIGQPIWTSLTLSTLAILILAQIMAVLPIGAYGRSSDFLSVRYFSEHMLASCAAFVGAVIVLYFFGLEYFKASRIAVLSTMAVTPFLTIYTRRIVQVRKNAHSRNHALLVIGESSARDMLTSWLERMHSSYTIYFVGSRTGLVDGSDQRAVNMVGATIEQAIVKLGEELDGVVIASNPDKLSVRFLNRLVALNFGVVPVYTLDSFYAREWQVVPLSTLSAPWALTEGFNLSQSRTYARLKRIEDIALSSLALVVLSPVFAIVSLLVKLDSRGPVIFRQERVGFHEKRFTLYKFRSMREGSERGPLYTGEHDNRITRIGSFLRHTRLDEIPQFFNVLRGDMSLVGPRAEWDRLVTDYERLIPYYHLRHLVKPGITGWAQVNYSYGSSLEDTQIKLRYDLYYVKYFSFMLDLSIIIKTAFVMIFGRGR
jgi:exopolysaccharide biosynthesis polyprenyl glycosylphosphotransferase